jgi:glycosyltransferase involved in cell wall biosynthesis
MKFHVLSFEGPDAYSRAGGLATRVDGLVQGLVGLGHESHLWFVGDPQQPGHESDGLLHLHRWSQWISEHHPGGVYDGEWGKRQDYSHTLPPYLFHEHLLPALQQKTRSVVLAEEWHTVDAVLHLDWLLRKAGARDRVAILWNANNTFGFDRINWPRLKAAAVITTVSRYMKYRMRSVGVEALVVHNGLGREAFEPIREGACAALRRRFRGRVIVTKMARWDPDKNWLGAIRIVAAMKRAGWRPLLIARGGAEAHGADVLASIAEHGLSRIDRWSNPGTAGLMDALRDIDATDVVNFKSPVDPIARRTLLRGSDVVLANSAHEPFGLVGLETMAAGGLACTGCTGEDYVLTGQNALVLETAQPEEFLRIFDRVRRTPGRERAMRRMGHSTARRFVWPKIIEHALLPRVAL